MIQVFMSLIQKFFKKKQTNIFEISKRKPTLKENENTLVTDHSIIIEAKEVKQQFKCRICLDQGETPDSAVCMPCKCSGSMKYVHVECLQAWIIQKKSLKCEICNYEYSVKWFKWAAQHNILDNPTLKKLQQANNEQRQRRQQAQNEQNRLRHYQNLLRSFGKRKSLTIIQKLQCLFLISGIIVSFVFAYSNNQQDTWQQSKNSNQHQRVYFTSLICYCLTIIIAYFWISSSKGFEYTFQTNLNYFKTHLPALQASNIINLQQQDYQQDMQLDQNNSNSQIEIEIQQQAQEGNQHNNQRNYLNLNQQLNENQIQLQQPQGEQQDISVQQNVQNNNQAEQIQQFQQNIVSKDQNNNVQIQDDIENQNKNAQDQYQNAKKPISSVEMDINAKTKAFKKDIRTGLILLYDNYQQAKQNNIQNNLPHNEEQALKQNEIHQSEDLQAQEKNPEQQPSFLTKNKDCLDLSSLKIDEQKKIIQFGESESSQETLSEKRKIKGEIKQNFNNEQQSQQLRKTNKENDDENIPSTNRDTKQQNSGFDINEQKLILKHKLKKQQIQQDTRQTGKTLQFEDQQAKIELIYHNDNKKNQQLELKNSIQELCEAKISEQPIQSIWNGAHDNDNTLCQQKTQEKQSTEEQKQTQEQQQEIIQECQVELINFESNQSMDIQDESIKSSSEQQQQTEDAKTYQFNNENVPSQKTVGQSSFRKQIHDNDINNNWQKYLKND